MSEVALLDTTRRALRALSPVEARVLGVLIEKQRTVPDTYPLTLNALAAGCNQKTSREPVMDLGETEVLRAIDRLKQDAWTVESSGGRVMRYAHNAERVLAVPAQSLALLAALLLRGPQTAGELRMNCERMHAFADISAVEAFLQELAARATGPLVVLLARLPGTREARWAQLLMGDVAAESITPAAPVASAAPAIQPSGGDSAPASEIASLRMCIEALQSEVAALKTAMTRLCDDLGVARPSHPRE